MRILNEEEIIDLVTDYHLSGVENRHVLVKKAVTKQHKQDIKDFIEWLEQWDEGRSGARLVPSSEIKQFKQLAGES